MQEHKGVGSDAVAVDFSKAPGRPQADEGPQAEGDRLLLEPNHDAIRPVAPSAVICPEHQAVQEDDVEQPGWYDYTLDAVRPALPRVPNFTTMLARSQDARPAPDIRDYRCVVAACCSGHVQSRTMHCDTI